MKYKELTVMTTAAGEELVADVFWDHTDYGVAVSSLKDVIELSSNKRVKFDYIDESVFSGNENVSLVKGYFPLETADEEISAISARLNEMKALSDGFIDFGSLEFVTRIVDGDDWIEIWRKHFKVHEFEKIDVCPEWIEYTGNKPVVYIGTNTAFGTGEHETTSMCIEYIEKYMTAGSVVVDVGTGSGILGIAAAKLGASTVYMTDNDEKAIDAAKHNVVYNGVENICKPMLAELSGGIKAQADMVVANITAEILVLLSEEILGYIKANGVLIMSGILNDRVDKVLSAFLPLGFTLKEKTTVGEWSAIVLIFA